MAERGTQTRAGRVIEFIETYCRVPEGKNVGQPVRLREFQKEEIRKIYDNPYGTRRAIISVGRKNGKTALVAMLLLAHMVGPEVRHNSQAYSTALSRDQASIIYKLAAKMVRLDEELNRMIAATDSSKRLLSLQTGVEYKALSADAPTAMGLSPALAIHDELGQVRGPISDLYEAVESGMGAHDAPLSIIISTQAPTDADLLSTLIDDAKSGTDPHTVLILYCLGEDDDPWDEANWHKANPALGDFLNLEEMRLAAESVKRLPARSPSFRNLRLNERIAATAHFLTTETWALNADDPDLGAFETGDVYGGVDLSSKNDLSALALVARGGDQRVSTLLYFFAPKDGAKERQLRDKAPYLQWEREELLTLTPGPTVDYAFIAHRIAKAAERMNIVELAFDRWRIDDLKRALENLNLKIGTRKETDEPAKEFKRKGKFDLVIREHGQGFRDMSPALENFEDLALKGMIRHGNNPVLKWCASNVVVTTDPAGARKFDKSKATGRIDGMQSLAMAIRSMSLDTVAAKAPVKRAITWL